MDLNKALNISAAGMDAQTMRLRVIAENLANQDTTGSSPGADAYRRKTGGVLVGQVLRDHPQPHGLGVHAGGGNVQCLVEVHCRLLRAVTKRQAEQAHVFLVDHRHQRLGGLGVRDLGQLRIQCDAIAVGTMRFLLHDRLQWATGRPRQMTRLGRTGATLAAFSNARAKDGRSLGWKPGVEALAMFCASTVWRWSAQASRCSARVNRPISVMI